MWDYDFKNASRIMKREIFIIALPEGLMIDFRMAWTVKFIFLTGNHSINSDGCHPVKLVSDMGVIHYCFTDFLISVWDLFVRRKKMKGLR